MSTDGATPPLHPYGLYMLDARSPAFYPCTTLNCIINQYYFIFFSCQHNIIVIYSALTITPRDCTWAKYHLYINIFLINQGEGCTGNRLIRHMSSSFQGGRLSESGWMRVIYYVQTIIIYVVPIIILSTYVSSIIVYRFFFFIKHTKGEYLLISHLQSIWVYNLSANNTPRLREFCFFLIFIYYSL